MSAKQYSFHHKDSGILHPNQLMLSDWSSLDVNTPADHVVIEGWFDCLSQRVDVATGAIVDYQPPAPSDQHEWNAVSRRWQLNAAAQDKANRARFARGRIARLENDMLRPLREKALQLPGADERLQAIDDEIKALRADLQP